MTRKTFYNGDIAIWLKQGLVKQFEFPKSANLSLIALKPIKIDPVIKESTLKCSTKNFGGYLRRNIRKKIKNDECSNKL